MRPSQKGRGARNKGGGRKPVGNVINRVFESAGPEGKVRGTPQQIIEKYQNLARDAQTSGERVLSESFLQHAEHYARLLNAAQEQAEERRQQQAQQQAAESQREGDDSDAAQRPGDDRRDRRNGAHVAPEPKAAEGASALETIDPADSNDGGPVDTPETAPRQDEPVAKAEPPKKPRVRRRRKPAAEDAEAPVEPAAENN
jgi:hypothetical protein